MEIYKEFCDFCVAQSKTDAFSIEENIIKIAVASNYMDVGKAKLFIISDKMKYIFENTMCTNINSEINLPFDYLFINTILTIGETKIKGIGIGGTQKIMENLGTDVDLSHEKSFVFTVLIEKNNKKSLENIEFGLKNNINKICIKKIKNEINNNILSKHEIYRINEFIFNILLFLNEPRVSTYVIYSNNVKRAKKGLIPLPSQLLTKITPELQEYININYQSHSKLGFMFDVRGHWRVLHSERYGENTGKKIWIAPHVRGEGLKANQIFKVCEK